MKDNIIKEKCNICIIGSGIAGLTIARGFVDTNVQVIIVEKGEETPKLNEHDDSIKFHQNKYSGATKGRGIGLGGTSAFWGGQLLSIHGEEMHRNGLKTKWPINRDDLEKYFKTVDGWLNLSENSENITYLRNHNHPAAMLDVSKISLRISKWLPYHKRNVHSIWKNSFTNNIRFKMSSVPENLEFETRDELACIKSMTFRATNGILTKVEADDFILCGGALDTPALLTKISKHCGVRNNDKFNGKYLHDHIAINIAEVRLKDRSKFIELFSPVYLNKVKHSIRLEPQPMKHNYAEHGAAYFHFISDTPKTSGINTIRSILRGLQSLDLNLILINTMRLPLAIPDFVELLWWRLTKKRFVFPKSSKTYLQINLEQNPDVNNWVSPQTSNLEDQSIEINWKSCIAAPKTLELYVALFQEFWITNKLDSCAELNFLDTKGLSERNNNIYDIYHPAGTCRMADIEEKGVVDRNLKVFEYKNLYIASTAVFPYMGAANPTYTLMALAARLSDHLMLRLKLTSLK